MRRRDFLHRTAVTALAPLASGLVHAAAGPGSVHGYGPLEADPRGLLALPRGFRYRVISRAGAAMDDGLVVPGLPDGMHVFPGGDGEIVLMRNHELDTWGGPSAFAARGDHPGADHGARVYDYDADRGRLAGRGGVTAVVMDADTARVRRQYLALGGTVRNCAGGATPWGTWISCEESTVRAGERGARVDHGYNFEVPARGEGLVQAVPLRAMGRFNHEAVAVDPDTGIVYQTEDRLDGLFYRFVPAQPGALAAGGRLEALAVPGQPGVFTGNWPGRGARFEPGREMDVAWVAMDDVEAPRDDLRHRGRAAGAAVFCRGEGMAVQSPGGAAPVSIWFACTAGGANARGQIWRYVPASGAGGQLSLFAEPNDLRHLDYADNLAVAPNGDLLVCEDNTRSQRLVGITPRGGFYLLAANSRGDSEFAGAAFDPSGTWLFVNLQVPGITLAIEGPWGDRRD